MPTALELTSAERQSYIEALRRRMALLERPLTRDETLKREQLLAQAKIGGW